MPELDVSPAFEAGLRRGLADLAADAPVPDDAHLDALERRTIDVLPQEPRNRRPVALVAAVVLVLAGLAGALALRDDDRPATFDKVSGEITTTTTPTTTTAVGPVITARDLTAPLGGAPVGGAPEAGLMNGITDPATLAEEWAAAGLPVPDLPTIDFSQEVVVEIVLDDVGCPSPDIEFQKGLAAVRAHVVEPSPCIDPPGAPEPRAYFYTLRWADTGRPFNLDVVDPIDPDGVGSITVD